jgi:hypothetical protein
VPNVTELTQDRLAEMLALNAELDAAHERAARTALLEHARMGRSVCESRDGRVVWIAPEEIFARYGLDANGKPVGAAGSTPPTGT